MVPTMRTGTIIFLGSPLIDLTVNVDLSFLHKYNLEPDNAYVMDETTRNILDGKKQSDITVKVGGSVSNTARIFNKILQKSASSSNCIYLGAIGDDEFGWTIKTELRSENINFQCVEIEHEPTGKVVVLLTDKSRSLVTDLGASKFYSVKHLEGTAWNLITESDYFYVSAFFISVSFTIITKIITNFSTRKKHIFINLGAPFLAQKYTAHLTYMFANSELVFGNEAEHRSFAKANNVEDVDLKKTLLSINQLFPSEWPRGLVVTKGSEPIIVVHGDTIQEFAVPKIDKVVDTNGAGDAFAGGFLASYVRGKNTAQCVSAGIEAAKIIVQDFGFDLTHF